MNPATPRPAGTVVLIRGNAADASPEVFVMHRPASMQFAAGMTVFPGGAVEPEDVTGHTPRLGPDDAWWAHKLCCTTEQARGFVMAALRETFEECGVLFAGPRSQPAELASAQHVAEVSARLASGMPFAHAVLAGDLVLRPDRLVPWARWITPPGLPRRFDASFFMASVPPGQEALVGHDVTEAEHAEWLSPKAVLDLVARGERDIMPPTRAVLMDCAQAATAEELLARRPVIRPVQPDHAPDTLKMAIVDETGE